MGGHSRGSNGGEARFDARADESPGELDAVHKTQSTRSGPICNRPEKRYSAPGHEAHDHEKELTR
jgi:hypothetical protein